MLPCHAALSHTCGCNEQAALPCKVVDLLDKLLRPIERPTPNGTLDELRALVPEHISGNDK